jgi:aminopeptidase N
MGAPIMKASGFRSVCVCVLASLAACASPARAQDRAAIESLLAGAESALEAHDVDGLLAAYDPGNTELVERTRNQARGLVSLSGLRVAHRIARLSGSVEDVEAVVLLDLRYEDQGREQISSTWRTMRFRRFPAGWRIVEDEDLEFARCADTDLRVDLRPDQGRMEGTISLRIEILADGGDSLLFGLNRGLSVTSVVDDEGRALSFDRVAYRLSIRDLGVLRSGDVRRITIAFRGELFNESQEMGYSQVSLSPAGSFASWVTDWYPRLRGSGSKSKGKIAFSVPSGTVVASNGRLAGRETHGDRETQTFAIDRPLDFSFAAAKYFHREQTIEGMQLGVYLLSGGEAKADLYLRECARALRCEVGFFGGYPFDGYALVEIPSEKTGGLGGSSEQGMNLFPVGVLPDDRFPLLLVAHEMGHGWWGNLVKSKHGEAILDEGLAQISAALTLRELEGEKAMRSYLYRGVPDYGQSAREYFARFASGKEQDLALGADATGSHASSAAHDIADTKGVCVYAMLRDKVGHEAFLKGLRDVIHSSAGKAIGIPELEAAIEKASRKKLDRFFREWFFRAGAPEFVLRSSIEPADHGFAVSGTVEQAGEPYEVDAEIAIAFAGRTERRTVRVDGPSTAFSFRTDEKPLLVAFDPEHKLLRWTAEFRNAPLLREGMGLQGMGKHEEAFEKLQEFVDQAPDSLRGHCQLGLLLQEVGDFVHAEECFRFVADRYRALGVYEPAVSTSALHLGQVLDLAKRREEAKEAYQIALELPDESGSRKAAESGLAAPYEPTPRSAPPTAEALARFTGTYGDGKGAEIVVAVDDRGVPTLQRTGRASTSLVWIEGAKFRLASADHITVEFLGGETVAAAEMTVGSNVIHLLRKP